MGAVIDERRPLVCLPAEETVELVKALTCRPAVELAGDACLPSGRLVPLSKGRCAVVIQPQYLGHRCDVSRNLTGVPGIGRPCLDNTVLIVNNLISNDFYSDMGRRAGGRCVGADKPQTIFC